METQPIIVITGPTATGKTALGAALSLALGGEVISADSMQIYRGMDIGTAKATAAEMRGVPHHMIDVADPAESWSVARWAREAAAGYPAARRRRGAGDRAGGAPPPPSGSRPATTVKNPYFRS